MTLAWLECETALVYVQKKSAMNVGSFGVPNVGNADGNMLGSMVL